MFEWSVLRFESGLLGTSRVPVATKLVTKKDTKSTKDGIRSVIVRQSGRVKKNRVSPGCAREFDDPRYCSPRTLGDVYSNGERDRVPVLGRTFSFRPCDLRSTQVEVSDEEADIERCQVCQARHRVVVFHKKLDLPTLTR